MANILIVCTFPLLSHLLHCTATRPPSLIAIMPLFIYLVKMGCEILYIFPYIYFELSTTWAPRMAGMPVIAISRVRMNKNEYESSSCTVQATPNRRSANTYFALVMCVCVCIWVSSLSRSRWIVYALHFPVSIGNCWQKAKRTKERRPSFSWENPCKILTDKMSAEIEVLVLCGVLMHSSGIYMHRARASIDFQVWLIVVAVVAFSAISI